MLEVEIKAPCDDLERIARIIVEMGGTFLENLHERDIYYNHPGRDFRITDEAFRIRVMNERYRITYKGPKIGGRSKTRFEAEIGIDDPDGMAVILERLGFTKTGEVVKKRALYRIGGTEICLDEVEGVGRFVELEQMGGDREKIETALFGLAAMLGLSRFERRSYLEMRLEGR